MADAVTIQTLEREWREALLAKDEAALRRLIHPHFKLVGIRPSGSVAVDLDGWIEALKKMDIASLDVTVIDCEQFDTVMVGTIDATWQVRYLGQLIDERVLLTDVWVCNDGQWQVIRRHSSPVPHGVDIER
ncbi:nuclear transport factor 2 family protein [Sphingomicrobium marinum]|uniref:nuclear transport factor 2 family protein n=1 Tax=Sphingomicrobium marinum TaxID=1227950 RepID=UPI00224073FC|nr:nuclear transport factor 2 family protein [Sphingomicrobium marinum]